MFRLVRLLFVLLICLAVVGLYRGWFSFSSRSEKAADRTDIDMSVNKKQIKDDLHKVQRKVGQEIIELRGKPKQPETK